MTTSSKTSGSSGSSTPSISSVNPNQVGLAQQATITINGSNLSGTSLICFDKPGSKAGSGPAGIICSVTDTQVVVRTPICPGGYPVTSGAVAVDLTIGVGANDTQFSGLFSFQLPTVTSITPASGPLAGSTPITVNGQYFTGAGAVLFASAGAPTFQVLSDTLITCMNPNRASACSASVQVMVQGQTSNGNVSFAYESLPAVTQISPNSGTAGTVVTLTGSAFVGVTQVMFGALAASSYTVVNATTINATVPDGGNGIVDVTVTASGGSSATTAADRFQFGKGPFTIPLTIDLGAAQLPAGTPAYAYIVGEVAEAGGTKTYYWLNGDGQPQAMAASDNQQPANTFPGMSAPPSSWQTALAANYPNAWANYSLPLSLTEPTVVNLANINPISTPGLGTGTAAFSGRLYISIGKPILPFTVQTGGYTAPVPGAANSGQPGALCLFDWIEFSFDSNQSFNGNTTQVDQFGMILTLDGKPDGALQGKLNSKRSAVIAAFDTDGSVTAPFGAGVLVVKVPSALAENKVYLNSAQDITHLRLMSPKNVAGPTDYTGPLATFYDSAISTWYGNWKTTPVVTNDTQTGYYTGFVPSTGGNAGQLCFYAGQLSSQPSTPPAFTLLGAAGSNITTWDIWQCANSLALPNAPTAQLNVGKILAAAFNRGTLGYSLTDVDCTNRGDSFYPEGGIWNVWAQQFHAFSSNQLAYSFPYDDVCAQNPSIDLNETLSVAIALGSLS